MPSVIGFQADAAIAALTEAGFKVTQERTFSKRPKDTVIKQDPVANTVVLPQSDVTITISDGIEQVEVKDVVGKQFESARTILTGDGFKVVQKGKSSDTVPEGQVISQDPIAGTSTDKGSNVTLTVSRGVAKVVVPNVINLPEGRGAPADRGRRIRGLGRQRAVRHDRRRHRHLPGSRARTGGPRRPRPSPSSCRPARRRRKCPTSAASRRTTPGPRSRTSGSPSRWPTCRRSIRLRTASSSRLDPPQGETVNQGSTVTMSVGRLGP